MTRVDVSRQNAYRHLAVSRLAARPAVGRCAHLRCTHPSSRPDRGHVGRRRRQRADKRVCPRVAGLGTVENADGAAVRAVSDARLETSLTGAAARRSDSHQGWADHLALGQWATHSVPLWDLRGHARALAADALRAGVADWASIERIRASDMIDRLLAALSLSAMPLIVAAPLWS